MPRYTPEPVPDFADDEQELRRYLQQELGRLSEAVNQRVDRAYGGLRQDGTTILSPLTAAPVLFDPFTDQTPQRPDGVEGDIVAASLSVLSGGAYMFSFGTTISSIPPNAQYDFFLALNGVQTGLGYTVDPSNQTEAATVDLNLLVNAQKGDTFTVLISSVTNTDAEVSASSFSAARVSEEQ